MSRSKAGRPTVPGYVIQAPGEYSMGPSMGFLKPVTYQQLVDHFGTPLIIPPPEAADGRIQVIWRVLWTDGSANEIYDYKVGPHWLGPMEGTEYAEVTEWDVSGDEKGYRHLLKLFGVQSDFAEPIANPKKQHRRPDLATEVVMAFVPTTQNAAEIKRRLMR